MSESYLRGKEKYFSSIYENSNHFVELLYDSKRNRTSKYDPKITTMRRESKFEVMYLNRTSEVLPTDKFVFQFETESASSKTRFELSERQKEHMGMKFVGRHIASEQVTSFTFYISSEFPVGHFYVSILLKEKSLTGKMSFFVIFNPFHTSEQVYLEDKNALEEFVFGTKMKIFSGSFNNYSYFKYNVGQFSLAALLVAARALRMIPLEQRTNVVQLSRWMTAFVNGNDEGGIMYGNWGEITSGTSPTQWRDARDIFEQYLSTGRPVCYGQCFVFALLLASLYRTLGIPARCVSGFNIAHDNNLDGIATIYLDNDTMEVTSRSETLWNFHCWVNAHYFWKGRHGDSEFGQYCWHHLDATPQETSQGVYQCGPFPVQEIQEGKHLSKVYDGLSIYNSLNCKVKYVFLDRNKNVLRHYFKNEAGKLILSTREALQLEDLTPVYKRVKKPADRNYDVKKLKVELNVPKTSKYSDVIDYCVEISNASIDSKTIVRVVCSLVDHLGHIITPNIENREVSFNEWNYQLEGKVGPIKIKRPVDLTLAVLKWEVRCYDEALEKFKTRTATTAMWPPISCDVDLKSYHFVGKEIQVGFSVTNHLSSDIRDVTFKVYIKGGNAEASLSGILLEANRTDVHSVKAEVNKRGFHKVQVWVHCNLFSGKLCSKSILVM